MVNKLLIYTENHSRGGSNRYCLDLMDAISNKYDETIVVSNRNGFFAEEIKLLNGNRKLVELKVASKVFAQIKAPQLINSHMILRKLWGFFLLCAEPFNNVYNAILFGALLLRVKPDRVLVCNGGYPGATSCLVMTIVTKIMGIAADLSIVSMPTPRRKYLFKVEKMFDFIVWNCSNRIITNCAAIGESLTKMRGLPEDRAIVLPNGVKDSPSYVPKSYPNILRKRKIIIGFVSRIEESKGVFVLMNAFLKLENLRHVFELRFYGYGTDYGKLIKMIETQGVSDRVLVFGHYFGDVSEIMRDMDIYVLPSFWEGLSYSLLEAMRAGLAIIATDVGGTTEAIENRISGIIVPPKSEQAILSAIVELSKKPDLMNSIRKGAREAFLAKFELGKTCENTRAVFFDAQ